MISLSLSPHSKALRNSGSYHFLCALMKSRANIRLRTSLHQFGGSASLHPLLVILFQVL
uniref:Uncharacterized protein LOC105107492 n=1 Tax=Rhizophora mucronata TaxID=61149 RepID=A0A2P2IL89_RHIMU